MKTGDIVQHKQYKWIGRISACITDAAFWQNSVDAKQSAIFYIKWFDTPSKYYGYYDENALALYSPVVVENNLSDWLSTPAEKLRNVLATKQVRNAENIRKNRNIRLDGRGRFGR